MDAPKITLSLIQILIRKVHIIFIFITFVCSLLLIVLSLKLNLIGLFNLIAAQLLAKAKRVAYNSTKVIWHE